jgi:voltage-gated potassium channel
MRMRRSRLSILLELLGQRLLRVGVVYAAAFFGAAAAVFLIERGVQGTKFSTFGDAMWFSVVTMATVGYGDLYPVTAAGRIVTGVFILFTLTTIGFLLTAISEAVLEVKRMDEHGLIGTSMKGHIVVCGYGALARAALEDLLAAGRKVALLCETTEELALAKGHGSTGELYVTFGEASQEVLRDRLNAAEAEAFVIAFSDDVKTVIASLHARVVNPGARLVVALQREELRQTLIAGGVTYAASANELSGRLLASAAFEPEVAYLVEDITTGARGGYDLQQYEAGTALGGKKVVEVREQLHAMDGPLMIALAVWNGSGYELRPHPAPDLTVSERDHILVIANKEQAERLVERYHVRQGR